MTKAALLHALRRINLHDEVVFATPSDGEHDIAHAFVVTGSKGLVLVLTDSPEAAGVYADAESA